MTDRHTNEEREELIVGDQARGLDPDEAVDVSLLAAVLGDPSTWAEPRAGLEDAVVRAVANAGPGAPLEATRPVLRARRAIVLRRRIAVGAAAAAVVVVAAAVGLAARGPAGPDFEGELAATAVAPDASGSVHVSRNDGGFRITLDAGGLPALAEGEYLQAWLKDSAGTLVPVGTFSSSDERVTFWSGVSPATFPILTVTIEATDNDQSSSGRLVLSGEVHEG